MKLTLPKGEENDGLDRGELQNGLEGGKQLFCGKIEQEQSIKRQTY